MNTRHEPSGRIDPIERVLADQPLRQPGDQLDRRIDALLEGKKARPVVARIGPMISLVGATAAMIALALLIHYTLPGNPDSGGNVPGGIVEAEPDPALEIERRWAVLEPGRIMITEDRRAVQPMRYRTVRQTRWVDPQENVEYELTVPQERVLLLPIRVD